MSKFVIEKAVPLTERKKCANEYPFSQMGKGDSFFVPTYSAQEANRIRAGTRYYNIKVAIRKEAGGMRVWRVS